MKTQYSRKIQEGDEDLSIYFLGIKDLTKPSNLEPYFSCGKCIVDWAIGAILRGVAENLDLSPEYGLC